MTNYPGYGVNSTDAVDYRTEYKQLVRDVTRYNQAAEPLGMMNLFKRTTKEQIKFYMNNNEFVVSSEGNQAQWQKHKYYSRILPMDTYVVGGGWTDEMLEDAKPEEIAAWKEDVMVADQRLMAKRFFASTVGGDASGNYMGFWNGSTTEWTGGTNVAPNTVPATWKNTTFASTHNHYAVTGATTPALEDFTTIKSQITEHGYGLNGKLVMFVNQAVAKEIEDLAGWTTAMTSNNVVDSIAKFGIQSKVSTINGFTIVIDDWVPDNYMFALSTDGPCVAIREPLNGGGLRFFRGPYEDYPFKESYYKRRMGMAAFNRAAGAVYYLHADTYATASSNYTFEN